MQRSASQIRNDFIRYFGELHGHTFVPSSPVVPHSDPTLLFTNAGMNQFKDVFLGQGKRPYTRAVNSQKCIRAGGKHNDLDDVGKDTYHHTFFEMLGNWSFGDYFKEEAIRWAWELLTRVWGLDKRRLYVTVFAGDAKDRLDPDTEAADLWRSVTDIDPTHISRWGRKDNFWEMGETGPCGPCTEIHFDQTENGSGGPLVNLSDPRVIEIWNLVFIQFNRNEDGSLTPLPARHVDTGMGFERVTRVLQGKLSNYDTDIWTPIFMAIEQRTKSRSYTGHLADPTDMAYRVVADHIRCLTFALTDGAVPGSEGRGYVLRRILRRAVRYGRQMLNTTGPFLYHLVPAVVESMSEAYPELAKSPRHVSDIIREEEESFLRTLDRGIALFTDAANRAFDAQASVISAADAFKLHDTYGFPVDLTSLMAEERGMKVDIAGYEALMEQARQTARDAATKGKESARFNLLPDHLARLKHMKVDETGDIDKFHGRPIRARIKAIFNGEDFDHSAQSDTLGSLVAVITNKTNFYGEMGGQVGDTGVIRDLSTGREAGGEFEVVDTQVVGGYVLHIGRVIRGRLTVGESVEMEVEHRRRQSIMANHTATHLLNLGLRKVLGEHVDQKGSLVAPDRLRFDFAHGAALSGEEVTRVAALVEDQIQRNLPVHAQEVPTQDARRINGLRAVFGERYPDPVRVVAVGPTVTDLLQNPDGAKWREYSIEFCGGTHVPATGEIEHFAIISEEAVAKGVRRVTAITGKPAAEAVANEGFFADRIGEVAAGSDLEFLTRLADVVEQVSSASLTLTGRSRLRSLIEPLQERARRLKKDAGAAGRETIINAARQIAETHAGRAIIAQLPDGAAGDTLRAAMDAVRSRHAESAILLASADRESGKVAIIAAVPESLIRLGLKAGDWVRETARVCGGGGGGRPNMAEAGGKDPGRIADALTRAHAYSGEILGT